jgi:hypothetical protein
MRFHDAFYRSSGFVKYSRVYRPQGWWTRLFLSQVGLAKALESALKRAAASVSFFNILRSREGEPFLVALSRWF